MKNRILCASSAVAAFVFAAGCGRQKPFDLTEGYSDECSVHKIKMAKREFAMIGDQRDVRRLQSEMERLAGSMERFREIEEERFPHSNQPIFLPEGEWSFPTRYITFYCASCVRAFAVWRAFTRANQPVEPTGTSVTDRADARSAPAAPVAHE